MASTEHTFIEAGGHRARVVERGDGFPVVVLHGWGGRIESMAPVLDCLEASFRVVAIDLPGFGESPLPTGVWGTPDYATFVRDLLREVGVERAHFVGHSYGAKTSLYLAATVPALVDKLVLQASSGLRTPPSFQARLKRGVSRTARVAGRFGDPGVRVRDALYRRIQSSDYRDAGDLRPILVKVVNEDLEGLLPRVQASTLLIWGSKDDAVPMSHARTMERSIPDAGLVVFEGAGHFAYLDEPGRFCRVVRHFLGAAG
ncbi:MAG TPA: alpha/beta fold hydrolase [Actinomycetota bacterium]|nr:alpha/beta fold hydrolase [Actinomycetota bacterium]